MRCKIKQKIMIHSFLKMKLYVILCTYVSIYETKKILNKLFLYINFVNI